MISALVEAGRDQAMESQELNLCCTNAGSSVIGLGSWSYMFSRIRACLKQGGNWGFAAVVGDAGVSLRASRAAKGKERLL